MPTGERTPGQVGRGLGGRKKPSNSNAIRRRKVEGLSSLFIILFFYMPPAKKLRSWPELEADSLCSFLHQVYGCFDSGENMLRRYFLGLRFVKLASLNRGAYVVTIFGISSEKASQIAFVGR